MTTPDPNNPQAPDGADRRLAPETLELRAPPRPVTRINRKVLIGAAAVVLLLIAGLVLVALRAAEPARRRPEGAFQCRAQADRGCAVQAPRHL